MNKVIVTRHYPIISYKSIGFVKALIQHSHGRWEIVETFDVKEAQRFGPEIEFVVKGLDESTAFIGNVDDLDLIDLKPVLDVFTLTDV